MKLILSITLTALATSAVAQFSNPDSQQRIYYSAGNMGIGTDIPDNALTIDGQLGFFRNGTSPTNNSAGYIKYDGNFTIGTSSSVNPLVLQTNSTDRLLIDNTGSVGIGTTTPDNTLTIDGQLGFFRNGTSPTNISAGYIKYENSFAIGTSSSVNPLVLQTNSTDRLLIDNTGRIGIGTNSPHKTLTIDDELGFFRNGTSPTSASPGFIKYENSFIIGTSSSDNALVFQTNSSDRILIDNTGRVGLGCNNPDSKLTVRGTVHSEEVKVDLMNSICLDYVFEPDYDLPTLSEIEIYIKENKHLPEVTSAKEMEENGINLKEMNLILLKKVEELTLHLIEMKKTDDQLKKENETLRSLMHEILQSKDQRMNKFLKQ